MCVGVVYPQLTGGRLSLNGSVCQLLAGSITNKALNEVLMDTCCELTSHCWPQDSGKKRKKESVKSSQVDGKRSKPQRKEYAEVWITNHTPIGLSLEDMTNSSYCHISNIQ